MAGSTGNTGAGFSVAGRPVGDGRCFVIAEAGVNHNGDMALAHLLVDAAAAAGADAVKFQTFRADRLAAPAAPTAEYQRRNAGATDQRAMLAALELSEADHVALIAHCREAGIVFLSSAFDHDSIDLLDRLGVAAFKVPSPDCVNTPYLRRLAGLGRPVILSTGMCDMQDVGLGVNTLRAGGCEAIALLHCTSCYPAPDDELHLAAMRPMGECFGLPVGYSDHSEGVAVSIAAVALGAAVIEKHLTLDRTLPGPDHVASIEPDDFAALVRGVRQVERATGRPEKRPQPSERDTRVAARRSVAAARPLAAGARLQAEDAVILRPGGGYPPDALKYLLGRRLARDVAAGALLAPEDFD